MANLTRPIATRARSLDYSSIAGWLPNPDPILKALGTDITTYRDMRADAHVGGCIRRRKSAVKNLEWALERGPTPARVYKSLLAILSEMLSTTNPTEPGAGPGLPALISEALDGALYGYQPLEVSWARAGSLLVPAVVQGKPPEWFIFDTDNQLRFRANDGSGWGELLPPRKFLLARQDATYANPYGQPDLAMCYWPWAFRKAAKFWVSWLERYGGDFLIGKQPRVLGTQAETKAAYADLADKLYAMLQDSIAVVPDDGSIEVLASGSKGGSSDAHERFLLYWRGEISIALLGTNQSTEQTSTLASATAALDVAADIRDGDARMIEATVNQLIRWIIDLNWPGTAPPVWSLHEQEEIDTTRPTRDKLLVECGVKFSRDYWLRTYDLEDDDLAEEPDPALAPPVPETPDTTIAEAEDDPEAAQEAAEDAPALAAPPLTTPDSVDRQTATLVRQTAPLMDDWLARVRRDLDAYIKAGRTAADFAAHLLTLYPDLPGDDMTAIMGEALAAAELAGHYELAQETDG
jgi:phage gp29-like protein